VITYAVHKFRQEKLFGFLINKRQHISTTYESALPEESWNLPNLIANPAV
jgi:hypothetical protein